MIILPWYLWAYNSFTQEFGTMKKAGPDMNLQWRRQKQTESHEYCTSKTALFSRMEKRILAEEADTL